MKFRYRIKFSKLEYLKYIGHLDLITVFQRIIKKSKLPISYSNGFNPHQMTSFALPLSLGVESISEYLDIQLNECLDEADIKKMLNENSIPKLEILEVKQLNEFDGKCAAILERGSYEITINKIDDLENAVKKLLSLEEILVMKKTKKKILKEVDIKNDIFDLKVISNNKLYLCISTGSKRNIKPELVVKKLFDLSYVEYKKECFSILRTGLYKKDGDSFVHLMS